MKQLKASILLSALILILSGTAANAQSNFSTDDRVLFTLDGQDVKVSEFEYVYTKNNINGQADYSKASLDEYMDLYIKFRLKVKEAEERGMDTIKALNDELGTYRRQLASSYLTDRQIFDKLMQEAYERMKLEVNASHIMVKLEEDAPAIDTIAALKKINELRKRIVENDEDFAEVAVKYSEDPSAIKNEGNLGHFSVFQTIYSFETAAYETPIGEVSQPIRTKYGYHLVKVHERRPARGQILVSHLLVKLPKNPTAEDQKTAQNTVNRHYNAITTGAMTFEEAVQQHSDDKKTRNNKGQLPWFGTGKMLAEFEEAAFALNEDGDMSKPIKTSLGWHIIKRLEKKDLLPFADMKAQIKRKVERDGRSKLAKGALIAKIKSDYGFVSFPAVKEDFYNKVNDDIVKGRWKMEDKSKFSGILFELDGKKYDQVAFGEFLEQTHKRKINEDKTKTLDELYMRFVNESCLNYEENKLEEKYPDFKALMKEYRDGILLFELTDQMVWSKAIEDTTGLKKFHEANRNNYMWGERLDASIYTVTDPSILKKVRKLAGKGMRSDAVLAKLAKKGRDKNVSIIEDKFEKEDNDLIDQIKWQEGLTEVITNDDQSQSFVFVHQVRQPEPKELYEAKGYVVSDYQEYLEKEWIDELRGKYPVELNDAVFQSLIKK